MSESIADNPRAITEALGADYAIRVGGIGVTEILTGVAPQLVRFAQRLHNEVERIDDTPTNAIERTVSKLYGLLQPEQAGELDDHQVRHILTAANSLISANQQHQTGSEPDHVIFGLFETYFVHQAALSDTTAGHLLRIVGDDLAIDIEFDLDTTWTLYERALAAHQRR